MKNIFTLKNLFIYSIILILSFTILLYAYSTGITELTKKSNTPGCTCHHDGLSEDCLSAGDALRQPALSQFMALNEDHDRHYQNESCAKSQVGDRPNVGWKGMLHLQENLDQLRDRLDRDPVGDRRLLPGSLARRHRHP